jgi:predicted helicase
LLADYKKDLKERKINLDDDFIKFFRFAQWKVEQTGYGIAAYISNNTYLDGITHRRMRESLATTFDDIYVLNLHGSSRKGEVSPDASKDDNVFDIRVGVAITLLIKRPKRISPEVATSIKYGELWGAREHKYDFLSSHDVATSEWTEVPLIAPNFFFTPKDFVYTDEYMQWPRLIGDVFVSSMAGIQTKRDRLVYAFSKEELTKVLEDVKSCSHEELRVKYNLPPDGRDWSVRAAVTDVENNEGVIAPVLYHPFDIRWTLYSGKTKGFMAYPRHPMMANAIKDNRLLLIIRNSRRGNVDNVFVASTLVDKDAVSGFDNATACPLYTYGMKPQPELFDTEGEDGNNGKTVNFSKEFLEMMATRLNVEVLKDGVGDLEMSIGPDDIFAYIYAVLHSPSYRSRYAEHIKIDFPRMPIPSNLRLFVTLRNKGEELIELHLMNRQVQPATRYPKAGSNDVGEVRFELLEGSEVGRVWINKQQYFEEVPAEVWGFCIGGYPVCEKWLKRRKGRQLTYDDLSTFQQIIGVIAETKRLMAEIDDAIPTWPIE